MIAQYLSENALPLTAVKSTITAGMNCSSVSLPHLVATTIAILYNAGLIECRVLSVQMAASKAAVSAVGDLSSGFVYDRLLCRSVQALAKRIRPQTRLVALDITPTHVSLAVSDRLQRNAAPFGVLARSGEVHIDARSISRAVRHANALEEKGSLDLCAIVVGSAPDEPAPFEYVDGLLRHGLDDEEVIRPFPDLDAVLFYSEAEALRRALTDLDDFVRALKILPGLRERRKLSRFQTAMNPVVKEEEIVLEGQTRTRLACSELLQAVLDDLTALQRENHVDS